MIENKINALHEIGLNNYQIEQKTELGNGTISRILRTKRYRKTTEAKVDGFIYNIIKILVNLK